MQNSASFEQFQSTPRSADNTSLKLIEEVQSKRNEPVIKGNLSSDSSSNYKLPNLDFSIPLDASRDKAPKEFTTLTPNSNKSGVEGLYESVKDTLTGIFGTRDTLHDHVRLLARSGMSPAEREQLAREEKQLKAYNETTRNWELKSFGDKPGIPGLHFDNPPKTPMLDELNRRTTALEKNISEQAKKGMTPLQVAQLESGTATSALRAQYDNSLIAIVANYDGKGAIPAEVNRAVIAAAREERRIEERTSASNSSKGNRGSFDSGLPAIIFEEKSGNGKGQFVVKPSGGLNPRDLWF